MAVKVKMVESTRFEGADYERGKTYTMSEEAAAALGSSVEIVSHKSKDEAPEDTMAKEPKVKK